MTDKPEGLPTFEPTGEQRPPKKGELYLLDGWGIGKASKDSRSPAHIYRRVFRPAPPQLEDIARELTELEDEILGGIGSEEEGSSYGDGLCCAALSVSRLRSHILEAKGDHVADTSKEVERLREALRAERDDLRARMKDRTHYEGCEEAHPMCAALTRMDAALGPAAPGPTATEPSEAEIEAAFGMDVGGWANDFDCYRAAYLAGARRGSK